MRAMRATTLTLSVMLFASSARGVEASLVGVYVIDDSKRVMMQRRDLDFFARDSTLGKEAMEAVEEEDVFKMTHARVDVDDAVRAILLSGNVEGDDEAGAELALAHRGWLGDARGNALWRIRGGDSSVMGEKEEGRSGGVSVSHRRVGVFAPNAKGAVSGETIAAASVKRRTFIDESCGEIFGTVRAVGDADRSRDALQSYLSARSIAPHGTLRALVVTCEEPESGVAPGETFAIALERIEREGVSGVAVFYGADDNDVTLCVSSEDTPTRRALLALEESQTQQECGLLCETQVELIMGVLIAWGLLMTLLYGWGLMTDLDTPSYFAQPEDEKKD
jgi:hypothetical protein